MKKVTIVLLVLLMLASCFAFTSCQSRCEKRGYHDFYPEDTCRICKKTRCQVGEHDWNGNECENCGTTKCQAGEHRWYQDEICYDCGANRCKEGEHVYLSGECRWCKKTICKIEGHDYHQGYCTNCDKVSAFAWVYDIFDKPIEAPDQGGNEWNSTCPSSADGSHGWLNYKCIYCGAVLTNSGSMSFWDKVGQGAMMVSTMIAVTAIASLAYWLGCMFGWGWLTWVGHGLMVLMTIGMFITQHWAWGVVFLVLFGGAYIGLICPLITRRYYDYDRTIY